eukprot:5460064-Prymnesium_polylepis.1
MGARVIGRKGDGGSKGLLGMGRRGFLARRGAMRYRTLQVGAQAAPPPHVRVALSRGGGGGAAGCSGDEAIVGAAQLRALGVSVRVGAAAHEARRQQADGTACGEERGADGTWPPAVVGREA